jgi:hypothetical protein
VLDPLPLRRPHPARARRRHLAQPHQVHGVQVAAPRVDRGPGGVQHSQVGGDLSSAGTELDRGLGRQRVRRRTVHPLSLQGCPGPLERCDPVSGVRAGPVPEPGRLRPCDGTGDELVHGPDMGLPPVDARGRSAQRPLDRLVRLDAELHRVQRAQLLGRGCAGRRLTAGSGRIGAGARARARRHDQPRHDQQHDPDRRPAHEGRHISVVHAFVTPQGRTSQGPSVRSFCSLATTPRDA